MKKKTTVMLISASLVVLLIAIPIIFAHSHADNDIVRAVRAIKELYLEDIVDEVIAERAITGILSGLDDYSAYLSASEFKKIQHNMYGKYSGIGIKIVEKDGQYYVDDVSKHSPAHRLGIQAGDVLHLINGEPVPKNFLDLPSNISNITILSDQLYRTIPINKEEIHTDSAESSVIEGNIVLIKIKFFSDTTPSDLAAAWQNISNDRSLNGIILDLRDNTGGTLSGVIGAGEYLVNNAVITEVRDRSNKATKKYLSTDPGIDKAIPMVVLINQQSASGSEILASALQASERATLIGTKTFGKGRAQDFFVLPSGAAIKISTLEFYTPSGRAIEGRGIIPDIEILNANDQLLVAVNFLLHKAT